MCWAEGMPGENKLGMSVLEKEGVWAVERGVMNQVRAVAWTDVPCGPCCN